MKDSYTSFYDLGGTSQGQTLEGDPELVSCCCSEVESLFLGVVALLMELAPLMVVVGMRAVFSMRVVFSVSGISFVVLPKLLAPAPGHAEFFIVVKLGRS